MRQVESSTAVPCDEPTSFGLSFHPPSVLRCFPIQIQQDLQVFRVSRGMKEKVKLLPGGHCGSLQKTPTVQGQRRDQKAEERLEQAEMQ